MSNFFSLLPSELVCVILDKLKIQDRICLEIALKSDRELLIIDKQILEQARLDQETYEIDEEDYWEDLWKEQYLEDRAIAVDEDTSDYDSGYY